MTDKTLCLTRDLDAIRALFPITQRQLFLMNAALSPLNTRSRQALDDYLHWSAVDPGQRPEVREPVRESLARLLGGASADYAIMTSTGSGISLVAAGLNWQSGDNVVIPAGEHWNSTFPWLNLENRGVAVRFVSPDSCGRVQIEDVASRVDSRTRVICATAVRFDNGFRHNIRALADLAHSHGALLVVDGTQCAGASTIDVLDDGIDVLAGAGFKWLLGLAGTGYLYVNARARDAIAPVSPGMFAAEHSFTDLNFHDDARRYETGTVAHSLLHGWSAGLKLLTEIGIENVAKRNLQLTDRLIAGLSDLGFRILSPVDQTEERSAIVAVTAGDREANRVVFNRWSDAGIKVTMRKDILRISPNFFNTDEEIDALLSCL
jgi:selenocysteine lyase/cysteine desulfurase